MKVQLGRRLEAMKVQQNKARELQNPWEDMDVTFCLVADFLIKKKINISLVFFFFLLASSSNWCLDWFGNESLPVIPDDQSQLVLPFLTGSVPQLQVDSLTSTHGAIRARHSVHLQMTLSQLNYLPAISFATAQVSMSALNSAFLLNTSALNSSFLLSMLALNSSFLSSILHTTSALNSSFLLSTSALNSSFLHSILLSMSALSSSFLSFYLVCQL